MAIEQPVVKPRREQVKVGLRFMTTRKGMQVEGQVVSITTIETLRGSSQHIEVQWTNGDKPIPGDKDLLNLEHFLARYGTLR